MSREYPRYPLVGTGILISDGDKVLLVRREKDPGKGLWSIPGGMVELGEKVRDAAKREIKEETGLDVEIDGLLDVVDSIVPDEKGGIHYHYVLVDFYGHVVDGKLQASTDVREAKWVKINEISNFPVTKTLNILLNRMKSLPKKSQF